MFTTSKDTIEISNLQKFLALAGVSVILIAIVVFGSSRANSKNIEPSYNSCETRYDPTPCPEPDYSSTIEESKKYSDDTSEDHEDNCGGYSCKQLEQEANEEIEKTDREIDQSLRKQGIQ